MKVLTNMATSTTTLSLIQSSYPVSTDAFVSSQFTTQNFQPFSTAMVGSFSAVTENSRYSSSRHSNQENGRSLLASQSQPYSTYDNIQPSSPSIRNRPSSTTHQHLSNFYSNHPPPTAHNSQTPLTTHSNHSSPTAHNSQTPLAIHSNQQSLTSEVNQQHSSTQSNYPHSTVKSNQSLPIPQSNTHFMATSSDQLSQAPQNSQPSPVVSSIYPSSTLRGDQTSQIIQSLQLSPTAQTNTQLPTMRSNPISSNMQSNQPSHAMQSNRPWSTTQSNPLLLQPSITAQNQSENIQSNQPSSSTQSNHASIFTQSNQASLFTQSQQLPSTPNSNPSATQSTEFSKDILGSHGAVTIAEQGKSSLTSERPSTVLETYIASIRGTATQVLSFRTSRTRFGSIGTSVPSSLYRDVSLSSSQIQSSHSTQSTNHGWTSTETNKNVLPSHPTIFVSTDLQLMSDTSTDATTNFLAQRTYAPKSLLDSSSFSTLSHHSTEVLNTVSLLQLDSMQHLDPTESFHSITNSENSPVMSSEPLILSIGDETSNFETPSSSVMNSGSYSIKISSLSGDNTMPSRVVLLESESSDIDVLITIEAVTTTDPFIPSKASVSDFVSSTLPKNTAIYEHNSTSAQFDAPVTSTQYIRYSSVETSSPQDIQESRSEKLSSFIVESMDNALNTPIQTIAFRTDYDSYFVSQDQFSVSKTTEETLSASVLLSTPYTVDISSDKSETFRIHEQTPPLSDTTDIVSSIPNHVDSILDITSVYSWVTSSTQYDLQSMMLSSDYSKNNFEVSSQPSDSEMPPHSSSLEHTALSSTLETSSRSSQLLDVSTAFIVNTSPPRPDTITTLDESYITVNASSQSQTQQFTVFQPLSSEVVTLGSEMSTQTIDSTSTPNTTNTTEPSVVPDNMTYIFIRFDLEGNCTLIKQINLLGRVLNNVIFNQTIGLEVFELWDLKCNPFSIVFRIPDNITEVTYIEKRISSFKDTSLNLTLGGTSNTTIVIKIRSIRRVETRKMNEKTTQSLLDTVIISLAACTCGIIAALFMLAFIREKCWKNKYIGWRFSLTNCREKRTESVSLTGLPRSSSVHSEMKDNGSLAGHVNPSFGVYSSVENETELPTTSFMTSSDLRRSSGRLGKYRRSLTKRMKPNMNGHGISQNKSKIGTGVGKPGKQYSAMQGNSPYGLVIGLMGYQPNKEEDVYAIPKKQQKKSRVYGLAIRPTSSVPISYGNSEMNTTAPPIGVPVPPRRYHRRYLKLGEVTDSSENLVPRQKGRARSRDGVGGDKCGVDNPTFGVYDSKSSLHI